MKTKIRILDNLRKILSDVNGDIKYGEGWEEIADCIGKLEEGIAKLKLVGENNEN